MATGGAMPVAPAVQANWMDGVRTSSIGAAGLVGASALAYGVGYERNAFTLRAPRGARARPQFAAFSGAAPVRPAHADRQTRTSRSGCAILAGWCPIWSC